jgi:hypothetical protein
MTDVLLIQPPIRDFYLTAKRTVPYGLACIAAALTRQGFAVALVDALASRKSRPVDLPQELTDLSAFYGRPDASPFALFHGFRHFGASFEHIGRLAAECAAPLVGISALFTPYIGEALATAQAVKGRLPRCRVVLGGHHPTVAPESVLASEAVDYVLRGEGEASLPQLAAALRTGAELAAVPGIGYRRPDGTLHLNPPAVMRRLEEYPAPALDLLDRRRYRRHGRGSAVVVASRGCPMRCSYCSVGAGSWLPYRRRTVSAVLSEIEEAVGRQAAGFVDFEDENLALDRRWFMELLEGIVARFGAGALELRAMNGLYPPSLDPEVIAAMAAAGFKALNLSLGATQPQQLARFRRADVREAFDRALESAAAAGLTAVGYVIVGAPDQRAGDSLEDLLFLAERRVLAGVSVFYPAPGSADFDRCRHLGVLPTHYSRMRASALPIAHTTGRLETVTLLRLGRVLNFMKQLRDDGLPLPEPSVAAASGLDPGRRTESGRALLAGFLADGRIRGITPQGEIYPHRAAADLTAKFLGGLGRIPLAGVLAPSGSPNRDGKAGKG